MKNKLFDLFKGILIGLDTTIPGFSIGTLAIVLNIYERLINDLSDITKHPIRVLKDDWALGVGFIIGLVANIYLITFLLEYFPMQTSMFFVGLLIMTLPTSYKNLKNTAKIKIGEIISFVICLAVLIFVTFLNEGASKEADLSIGFMIVLVIVGAIASGAMIIPGVSGSLIILALGYYNLVITSLYGVINSVAHFNFSNITNDLIITCLFALGSIIGLISIPKLLKVLMEKYPSKVYAGILGLLIGSPFVTVYLTAKEYQINWSGVMLYISSAIVLAAGIAFGILIGKLENKNKTEENTNKEIEE